MAQQGASPGMAANPAAPQTPGGSGATGSSWEQSMMARLGPSVNPEDINMRRQLFALANAGAGPQFQGTGRPAWQSVGAGEAVGRIASAMGQGVPRGPADTGQGPRMAGYYASTQGPMGALWRQNPVQMEQTKWMGRG